jgi:hypothetical protein
MTLKELSAAGIHFSVSGVDTGFFVIPANEIPAYVTDPPSWYARQYGVSRERVETWQRFADSNYRCMATTRRGERCNLRAEEYWCLSVCDFEPARDGFCRQHRPKVDQAAGASVPGTPVSS